MVERKRTIPTGLHIENGRLTQAVWDTIFAALGDAAVNVGSQVSGLQESIRAVDTKATQAGTAAATANANVGNLAASGGGFYATVSPSGAYGEELAPAVVASNNVTVTAGGGTPPYTYAWTLSLGLTMTVDSPSAASTGFTSIGEVPAWTTFEDTATCTVTDAALLTTEVSVGVTLYGSSNDPPP